MKKSKFFMVITAIIMVFATSLNAQENYTISVKNSVVNWKGYKPTGSHEGTITMLSGTLMMRNNEVIYGDFIANMPTIKDKDGSEKLEGHLTSEDFFDVAKFPTASFKITNIEKNNEKLLVTGNLTIKGITKQIKFPASVKENGDVVTFSTEKIQINRTDFDIKYRSKSFFDDLKDKFINDEFDLQVTIVANKV